ncbi:hypothetical protein PVK06_045351 [Gossypium arboreum]|uniref:Secreted protein n=1 Tax=Gossypium arboreum TaxID=29729 RepID=A0ABR0MTU2_GOSAR|nr:hypothetical protein PVK06_045351 [Gossypium arboreum]
MRGCSSLPRGLLGTGVEICFIMVCTFKAPSSAGLEVSPRTSLVAYWRSSYVCKNKLFILCWNCDLACLCVCYLFRTVSAKTELVFEDFIVNSRTFCCALFVHLFSIVD